MLVLLHNRFIEFSAIPVLLALFKIGHFTIIRFAIHPEEIFVPVLAENTVFHSLNDSATRLIGVAAVAELAVCRQFTDFEKVSSIPC